MQVFNKARPAVIALVLISLSSACSKSGGDHSGASATRDLYAPRPAKILNADLVQAGGVSCTIDNISSQPVSNLVVVSKTKPFAVDGWIFMELDREPVTPLVYVVLTSNTAPPYYLEAKRKARPDVAAAYNNQLLGNAGFEASGAIANVPAGVYDLRVITGMNYLAFVCHPAISIKVTD